MDYAFTVEWVEGKTHLIADALSRNPVNETENEEEHSSLIASVLHSLDPNLDSIRQAAKACDSYQCLLNAVKSMDQDTYKSLPSSDPLKAFKAVWQNLSVDPSDQLVLCNCDRIVIPITERARLLDLLHLGHSGMTKTRTLARQLYYWPNMQQDISEMISKCEPCQEHLPQQRQQPLQQTIASAPLEHCSADLFSLGGKNYLAFADRYSVMVWADRLNSTTTSTVTKCLERWLYEFGFPKHIRTDGGPQFRGPFDDWCAENGIIHEVSSPYNPQSNGHAESAVKIAKFLIDKVDANMTQFRAHLYAWRNTPRQDGFSPSDLFFGRRQRSPKLPSLRKDACNLEAAETARSSTAAKAKEHFDKRAAPLPPLKPGDTVLLSGPGTAWGGKATVQDIRPDGRSYTVLPENSNETTRNRRLLLSIPNNEGEL